MTDKKKNLQLLFERPNEPVFTPKGKDNAVFQVPTRFLEDEYQNIGAEIQSRFDDEADVTIPVTDSGIPDITLPVQLNKSDNFSLFIPKHKKLAAALTDVFLSKFDLFVPSNLLTPSKLLTLTPFISLPTFVSSINFWLL